MATIKSRGGFDTPTSSGTGLPPPVAGLTLEQASTVFEKIATLANTLTRFARDAVPRAGVTEAATDLEIVAAFSEQIGLLADMPSGGDHVGGIAEWMLGPNFTTKGGAL